MNQTDLFVPPAAEGLPLAALDSATEGADRFDAAARTPTGRNFLAHALVQLARDGWLRTEPREGFEPMQDRETDPAVVSPPTGRAVVAERLWQVAEHNIIAEWICCDPINPKHQLCVQGDATLRMVRALLVDDPEAHRPAPLLDAVLGVLPEPTDRAAVLREAADIAESLRQFEPATGVRKSAQVSENVGILRVADHLRRLAVEAHGAGAQQQCPEREPLIGVQCSKRAGHEAHSDRPGRIWYPAPDDEAQQQEPTDEDVVEAHRLALSFAVGLGSGAPWDAVRDRAAELWAQQQPDTEAPRWAGATELVPEREITALASTGLVGYRQNAGRLLHCLAHKPAPASRYADFHEVTADDLDDGGICVHPDCGRDLLAPWPAAPVAQQPAAEVETCRPVEVDGETIRVHGASEMTEQERGYFTEIVRAAKRKYAAEHGAEQQTAAANDEETPFVPPAHYRRDDGVECCVHTIPVGPNSCTACRELADDD